MTMAIQYIYTRMRNQHTTYTHPFPLARTHLYKYIGLK